MVKKLFRSMLLGIVVFIVSVAAGCLAFVITYRYQTEKIQADHAAVSAREVYQPALPSCTYLVRLENEAVSVYARFPHGEEFLYSLEVPVSDLPPNDLARLKQGVMLPTKDALTAFEEDYTS